MMQYLTTPGWVETVLDRRAYVPTIDSADFEGERILITGGLGSIGLALADAFDEVGIDAVAADIDEMDVTDAVQVACVMDILRPTLIFHLAGAKHAPEGELDPLECVAVNTIGTQNVIANAPEGARIVTASTCKACDPETAYGASKLLAERLTLNAGHRVARFHNVVETSGNVFELWRAIPDAEPLPVAAACERYFISSAEAVGLLLRAALAPEAGRFIASPGRRHNMRDVAARLHPGRELVQTPSRRGDRLCEPRAARCEVPYMDTDTTERVYGPHDAQVPA